MKAASERIDSCVSTEEKLVHYDNVRQDLRDELKMRIGQRDNFAIQYFISSGAIIGGFAQFGNYYVLLLLPLVSLYYTTQILYSYYIHDMICYYLREKVEKKIISFTKDNPLYEWENFTRHNRDVCKIKVPGIRRNFFVYILWITFIFTEIFLFFYFEVTNSLNLINILVLSVSSILYLIFIVNITYKFVFKAKGRIFE